jgi:hypothetical protein
MLLTTSKGEVSISSSFFLFVVADVFVEAAAP